MSRRPTEKPALTWEIDVLAGDQPTRQTLDLRAGVLAVSAVLTVGAQPLALGVQYDVFEAAKDAEGNASRSRPAVRITPHRVFRCLRDATT